MPIPYAKPRPTPIYYHIINKDLYVSSNDAELIKQAV
jgi:hypothetical protein